MSKVSRTMMIVATLVLSVSLTACGSGGGEGGDGTADEVTGDDNTSDATEGEGTGISITDLKIVKLDGTEAELTARPIPRKVGIKTTLSDAMTEAADRQAVEDNVSLTDASGATVDGTFAWAADSLSVTFTPNRNLDYATAYSVNLNETSLPTLSLSKDYSGTRTFTTMTMGDVNGDGFSDALVGADLAPGGAGGGRVYLFHGSANGIANKDLSAASTDTIINGAASGDALGSSAAFAGDVNGDGYADIIVGAHLAAGGGTDRGMAYVFTGSASGIADCDLSAGCTPGAAISGTTDNGEFAYSVSGAGDVNGDGYDDVVIGEYNAEVPAGSGDYPGVTYVFFGGSTPAGDLTAAANANATIVGDVDKDYFGWSVASAGDVNGDGYDDVIISANGNNPYYVSVFHGGPSFGGNMTPAANATTRLIGPSIAGSFGRSVNTAGDINGDGYDDVIVGESFADNAGTLNTGAAHIYLGSANGVADCDMSTDPNCPHAKITGAMTDGKLGASVASAGDTNEDGFDDVLVGADHQGNIGQSFVYFFLGSAAGIADCDIKTTPDCPDAEIGSKSTFDQLGASVASAGDINGDGFADIILGAAIANGTGTNRGEAYILNGSANGIADCNLSTCTPATTFTGADNSDRLGFSVN